MGSKCRRSSKMGQNLQLGSSTAGSPEGRRLLIQSSTVFRTKWPFPKNSQKSTRIKQGPPRDQKPFPENGVRDGKTFPRKWGSGSQNHAKTKKSRTNPKLHLLTTSWCFDSRIRGPSRAPACGQGCVGVNGGVTQNHHTKTRTHETQKQASSLTLR